MNIYFTDIMPLILYIHYIGLFGLVPFSLFVS